MADSLVRFLFNLIILLTVGAYSTMTSLSCECCPLCEIFKHMNNELNRFSTENTDKTDLQGTRPQCDFFQNKSKLLFQSLEIKGRLKTWLFKAAKSFGPLPFVLKLVANVANIELMITLCAPELAWLVALPERGINTNQVEFFNLGI